MTTSRTEKGSPAQGGTIQESSVSPTYQAKAESTQSSAGAGKSRRFHVRDRWLVWLTILVIVAQFAACQPAKPRGSAGGMDATLLEQSALVPVLNQSQALALAPVVSDVSPDPAQALVQLSGDQSVNSAIVEEAPLLQTSVLPSQAGSSGALADGDYPLDETTNILVMGSDRRVGAPNWLTDVMMIVALDYENGKAGVISIPRDIYIDNIAGHQPNKLNVVDYLGEKDEEDGGGPALLSSIILEKMGIRIDHYVRFDFRGFIALVDALGGVDVEIDCPYYDYFQIEDVILNVKPGLERLSGDEALVYVRSRKLGGDLDRARRQQRFIWAVRNQVLNENILPKLPALYNAVSDNVQTDIGIVGTLKIARFVLGLDKEDITGYVIGYPQVQQGYVGNMWVFRADWDAIREQAQQVFEREPFIDTNTLVECP